MTTTNHNSGVTKSPAACRRAKTKALSANTNGNSNSTSRGSHSSTAKSSGAASAKASAFELYNTHRDLTTLAEQFKAVQLKELEQIKALRRLNTERLAPLIAAASKDSTTTTTTTTTDTATQQQSPPPAPLSLACCSCHKPFANASSGSGLRRCALCLDISHATCRLFKESVAPSSNSSAFKFHLCHTCERTRRPSLEHVVEMLVDYDKLEVRSLEGNALQMFVHRALGWRARYAQSAANDLQSSSTTTTTTSADASTSSNVEAMLDAYEKSSCLRKAELADLYLEGLLIEAHMDEMRPLGQLFRALNKSQLVDDVEKLGKMLRLVANSDSTATAAAATATPDASSRSHSHSNTPSANKLKKSSNNNNSNNSNNSSNNNSNKASTSNNSNNNQSSTTTTTSTPDAENAKTKRDREPATGGGKSKTTSLKRDIDQVEDEEFCAADKCSRPTGESSFHSCNSKV